MSGFTKKRNAPMDITQIVVAGTLNPDGTLVLDQKPSLSPGRVTVVLQTVQPSPSAQRSLAGVIDEIQLGQQARGFSGRTADEIDAALREGEEEYEQKVQGLRSQTPSAPPTEGN
jgi:hypothetical protein